jgi:CPA1 family monovalent cation:H+ antiporter
VSIFSLFAILITITALLAYLNERYTRMPVTIGVMASALVVSGLLILLGQFGLGLDRWAASVLEQIDFSQVLLHGMLSFLLFAGALHIDLSALLSRMPTILTLATAGVLLSTFLVGTAIFWLFTAMGLHVPYIYALVFGALITPTDPIAVLGILKNVETPKDLEAMIAGESLFNDGVGVVVFSVVLAIAVGGDHATWQGVASLFLIEAVGGAVYGFVLGFLAYRMLKSVDNYTVEVLITLSLVAGGYALAGALHTSGPIAMVVAGLFIGNHGRLHGMSVRTREHLDTFWELLDEILNALLFVVLGFELLILKIEPVYLLLGVLAIPVVVAARFISVGVPIKCLQLVRTFRPHTVKMMTWCGVRGGISVALALSLPPSPHRELLLLVTYLIVVFSIMVQGLTVGRLARRLFGTGEVQ